MQTAQGFVVLSKVCGQSMWVDVLMTEKRIKIQSDKGKKYTILKVYDMQEGC